MKIKLVIGLVAVMVVFFVSSRDSVRMPTGNRGEALFYGFERHITNFLDASVPFSLSTFGRDSDTGWRDMGSNRWELHGLITFPQHRVPWQAYVVDKGTNVSVETLWIGTNKIE